VCEKPKPKKPKVRAKSKAESKSKGKAESKSKGKVGVYDILTMLFHYTKAIEDKCNTIIASE
jgi:hypothetical protein